MRSFAFIVGLLFASSLLAGQATAIPIDPALQKQLLDLYDGYNKAITAGKLDEALQTRSAEVRKQLQNAFDDETQRPATLAFAKHMIPDRLELLHTNLSADGTRASIIAIVSKKIAAGATIPNGPPLGSTVRNELTLDFVKEQGAWRYDSQTFGVDPDKIETCKDERFESIDAYDQDRSTSMGGSIARVAFKSDHTLVVVRVLDEENCAYLPSKSTLEEKGFDTAHLVPYTSVEVEGYPHKSDGRKIWIENLTVQLE